MFSRVRSPTRRAGDKASPRGTVATTTAVSVEDAFVIGALHRGQIGPTYKTAGRKIPAGLRHAHPARGRTDAALWLAARRPARPALA